MFWHVRNLLDSKFANCSVEALADTSRCQNAYQKPPVRRGVEPFAVGLRHERKCSCVQIATHLVSRVHAVLNAVRSISS